MTIDADRIGLCGYSQGGWIAPLAASMDARVRFVSVAYGMIESPFYEALWETQDLLRSRGVDEAGISTHGIPSPQHQQITWYQVACLDLSLCTTTDHADPH